MVEFRRTRVSKAFTLFACVLLVVGALGGSALAQETSASGESTPSEVVVRAIVVRGNVEIDSDRILEQVQATKVGEPFDPEKVQEDVDRIAEMGYFQMVEANPTAAGNDATVAFVVREFPVVQDIQVVVRGDVVSSDEVRALIDLEEGRILNAREFQEQMSELPSKSDLELGYLLQPGNVEFAGTNGEVLKIEVVPIRLGQVLIEGNEKTKEEVIRRELTVAPGEILSTRELRNSLRRLGQLGYFEPIVPEFLETDDPYTVDVLLPVTELKTGRAAFGVGYSSADGFIGYVEYGDDNFLGRGEKANLKWEFGKLKNTYDLGFTEPYLFGSDISAGINLYNRLHRRQTFEGSTTYPYTTTRVGGDVTVGRPLGQFTRGFLTLKVEDSSVTPDSEPSVIEASSNRTRSVGASLRTDTTDHLFFPTLGFRYDIGVETAGRFLGGDTEFTKLETSYSKFIKAGQNNQTWAFRVMSGYGFGSLPLQEEFLVGGPETVRGYRYGEMRGDRMLVAQAEYRFPINKTVHGVVFVDAGNAWSGEPINLGELKKSFGVGIRFNTPLGVMRIDYGIGEEGGKASFSLGPSF